MKGLMVSHRLLTSVRVGIALTVHEAHGTVAVLCRVVQGLQTQVAVRHIQLEQIFVKLGSANVDTA